MIIHVETKKLYTARELLELGVFPRKDLRGVTRALVEDRAAEKPVLAAEIRGTGRTRRYYVLGKNVMRFLKNAD